MRNGRERFVSSFWLLLATAACSGDSEAKHRHDDETPREQDAGSTHVSVSEQSEQPTYWQDMVPLFEQHCLQCHREGGIAPFRLDTYAGAKPFALAIARAVSERTMPPWAVASDGSCGNFANSLALNDDEIARISDWAQSGAAEGSHAKVVVPDLPTLQDALELSTPEFLPKVGSGKLYENDEYRCFAIDLPKDTHGYVTGYEVQPGVPEIVHHLTGFVVNLNAKTTDEHGKEVDITNRERIQQLRDQSPDREGWPCYGVADDGLAIQSGFVVWAPGQGVVEYPKGTGLPIDSSKQQMVVQVHYNLTDTKQRGKVDQTRVRVRIEKDVNEVGTFLLDDPLLESAYGNNPTTLPPGKQSTKYIWKKSLKEMGMPDGITAKAYGVVPHMHGLGRKYTMNLTPEGSASQCVAQVDHWDSHWQRLYFYQEPYTITSRTQLEVTCDYDTTSVTQAVEPGWSANDEMCFGVLFITVDKKLYELIRP